MERARRHHRVLAASAFGLLALIAELAGRSLTHRLDVGRHVAAPSYAGADYYPFLLAGVKVGVALMLAVLTVVVALLYSAVARWLADYELYASTIAEAVRLSGSPPPRHRRPASHES